MIENFFLLIFQIELLLKNFVLRIHFDTIEYYLPKFIPNVFMSDIFFYILGVMIY